jgi:small ligand-binding sensory domain FIST
MVGAFPEAECTSFIMESKMMIHSKSNKSLDLTSEMLSKAGMNNPDDDWKIFMVFVVAEDPFLTTFIDQLQAKYPNATIVGGLTSFKVGVCNYNQFHFGTLYSSISVLAMKGNVPLHAVVTRGVEAISSSYSLKGMIYFLILIFLSLFQIFIYCIY